MGNLQEEKNQQAEKETVHINVNSRPKVVNQEVLTFEQIAALAFPTPDGIQNPIYTVTFKNADQKPSAGTLVAGESVKIKNGTIFNVTRTGQS
jgi:Multiubiquitin